MTIWLKKDQIAQLRAALLRARDHLKSREEDARSALRLGLVESALVRLNNGTYGECISCEEPLSLRALESRPEAPFCADCELERRGTIRDRRTG